MDADIPPTPMPLTVDLTGLPEPVVRQVLQIVHEARQRQQAEIPRPPSQADPEKWSAELRAWAASQPKRELTVDDSRESIYD